jgi:hypothetical protein
MKKGNYFWAWFFVSITLFSMLLVSNFAHAKITGNVIYNPTIPTSCSDANIKAIWDSIFNETSTGIIIASNTTLSGKCEGYMAAKNFSNKLYLLAGQDTYFTNATTGQIFNVIEITSLHGNFTANFISTTIQNISQNTINWSNKMTLMNFAFFITSALSRSPSINNASEASSEFTNLFKPENTSNWYYSGLLDSFVFNSSSNNLIGFTGQVSKNSYFDFFGYYNHTYPSCTPNWTAINTSCGTNEIFTIWYNDTKSCNSQTGRLNNITIGCDYNLNGVIGNFTSLTQSNTNISIYINSELANISKIFNTTLPVEFREGNITRIKFDYNFLTPLNMMNITIRKEPSSATLGYLIINGISSNKTVKVDKLNSSNKVCIKDAEISSISNISSSCDEDDEYLISCPGNSSGFACNISDNLFIVTGLQHSAVKEFIPTSNCTTNWNCSSWGNCINGTQTKTCIDQNSCNTTLNRPNLTQSCVITPTCTTNWNCTQWQPSDCPKNETQTRTCSDTNHCNSSIKTETNSCNYEEKTSLLPFIIAAGVFIFVAIIAIIVYFVLKKSSPKYIKPSGVIVKDYNQNQGPGYSPNPYSPPPGPLS